MTLPTGNYWSLSRLPSLRGFTEGYRYMTKGLKLMPSGRGGEQ